MRAGDYNGPRAVVVREVPDARSEKQTDVLVRITSTNICGSDLHMDEGRTELSAGDGCSHHAGQSGAADANQQRDDRRRRRAPFSDGRSPHLTQDQSRAR